MPPKDKAEKYENRIQSACENANDAKQSLPKRSFRLARRNVLLSGQYKAEMLFAKWRLEGLFRYGNFSLYTVFANIVLGKCACCRGGEHNFPNNEGKIASRSIENKKLDRNGKNEEQIMDAKRVQT